MNDDIKALAAAAHVRLDRLSERVERLERGWVTAPTLANPEPMPEWRALVEAADGDPDCRPYDSPLASVLDHLTTLASEDLLDHLTTLASEDLSAEGRKAALARIVAVCEAQVMGGWQADPDTVYHARSPHRCDVKCLIDALAGAQPWRVVGNRAAALLRDLTKADA